MKMGQQEKIAYQVVDMHAQVWGYGNMIAFLRRRWANMLIEKYKQEDADAVQATNVDAYDCDPLAKE